MQTALYASSGLYSTTAASATDTAIAYSLKKPGALPTGSSGQSQSLRSVSGKPSSSGKSKASHPQGRGPNPSSYPGNPPSSPLVYANF